ncbi:MAG TPA: histidine kinase dimerization/phospho-acceptor domain-containing protein [Gaiellaceae bacterium]|nr:histidine kinase dimerization/phospho-acceptor domain-containing protein [Gaiellaceae bacterium]
MGQDPAFAALVSLACHDLRTPLATVHGFARVLTRMEGLDEPLPRYLGMMSAASDQMGELLDELGLVARIESGRWEPASRDVDTLELARAAAERVSGAEIAVEGVGTQTTLDAGAAERALAGYARCAVRFGGVDRLELLVDGVTVSLGPVTPDAAPILAGEVVRDLGAAIAARVVDALGGSVALEGEALVVRLPRAPAGSTSGPGGAG